MGAIKPPSSFSFYSGFELFSHARDQGNFQGLLTALDV